LIEEVRRSAFQIFFLKDERFAFHSGGNMRLPESGTQFGALLVERRGVKLRDLAVEDLVELVFVDELLPFRDGFVLREAEDERLQQDAVVVL
jgi:hypothetical protein